MLEDFGHNFEWQCGTCKARHKGLPLDFGFDKPDYYFSIPEAERERRVFWNPDICVVDDEHFFIRGIVYLPIIGNSTESFRLGLWSTLSKSNFELTMDHWDDPKQSELPPMFGWLSNVVGLDYPSTLNLKTNVHLVSANTRPTIELEPTDHPLAVEQRNGITVTRVVQLAGMILHSQKN